MIMNRVSRLLAGFLMRLSAMLLGNRSGAGSQDGDFLRMGGLQDGQG